jgi:hypothetical protein
LDATVLEENSSGVPDTSEGPYYNEEVIAETDSLKALVVRTFHRAQKIFPFDDHMYIVQFLKKKNQPILLSDIKQILFSTFVAVLSNLKTYFQDEKERLIYMTLNQKNFTNGVRTSVHVLSDCNVQKMAETVMSDFNRFLNSNQSLELDSTFKIYFKVLSEVHVHYSKNRRVAVPIRHNKTGNSSTLRLRGSLISLPAGYPDDPLAFLNMCVLINLIFGWLKYHNNGQHAILKKLTLASKNNFAKNNAGKLLDKLVNEFCRTTNTKREGPYQLDLILPIFADYCKCQIHIIRSLEGIDPMILSHPEKNDYSKQRIYFFEHNNHLYLIDHFSTFCNYYKKGICVDCRKFYSHSYQNRHKCPKRDRCYKCQGILKTKETIQNPGEGLIFCDSKLFKNYQFCNKCQQTFDTPTCFTNHQKACVKDKFGWKCLKCNVFLNIKGDIANLQKNHICGERTKRCQYCFCIKEQKHLCQIPDQFEHLEWPNLAFLTMKFKTYITGNCNNCYLLKKKFALENNLSFKDLFKHKDYKTLFCSTHLCGTEYPEPNVINLYWEANERFSFSEYVFADDNLEMNINNTFCYVYANTKKNLSFTIFKGRKRVHNTSNIHNQHIKNMNGPFAIQKFFHFLFNSNVANTTFIVPSNKILVTILKAFLRQKLKPDVIQKGREIYVLEIPGLKCRFVNFTHYMSGSFYELAANFNIPYSPIFFPECWNETKNYFYNHDLPPLCDFYLFDDTVSTRRQKQNYYKMLQKPWNFFEKLHETARNDLKIFTNVCLYFVQICFDLQKDIAKFTSTKNKEAIHPFGAQLCSLSSFTMAIYKFYFYNKSNEKLFTVMAPYNGLASKSSKGEYEFMSLLCFYNPDLKIQTAFNHEDGQKNFGKYFVDGYSAAAKRVYQYRGCRVIAIRRKHLLNMSTKCRLDNLSSFTYRQLCRLFAASTICRVDNLSCR